MQPFFLSLGDKLVLDYLQGSTPLEALRGGALAVRGQPHGMPPLGSVGTTVG